MGFESNEWLTVNRGVNMTSVIEPVIIALDPYFKEANLKAVVTSGERTSGDQLRIIRNYAKQFGVDKEFKEILTCDVLDKITVGNEKIFAWQQAWSRLLSKNVIINPPLPANCLFDYFRNGVNKKGTLIGHSPHYYGKAFDIGGGLDHDITNELKVVERAFAEKKIPGFKGYLAERNNNAIHIDCV